MPRNSNLRPAQIAALRRVGEALHKPKPKPEERPARAVQPVASTTRREASLPFRAKRWKASVYTHEQGGFEKLTGRNILLYWHHGFGDWVQFSLVLPFLNPANRYWMTRWGDDTVTLMDGQPYAQPICLGVNGCSEDGGTGIAHFGLDLQKIDGGERELVVPESLCDQLRQHEIDAVLCGEYPEPCGKSAPPFHTKPRNMIDRLVRQCPNEFHKPLRRTLTLDEDPLLFGIVRAKLQNCCGLGERKLCLIAHRGQTSQYKNWGNLWREELPQGRQAPGQECRDFMEEMLRKDRNWFFLLMEERPFPDSVKSSERNCYAYCDVFGQPETGWAPFARVLKCLTQMASLCVGVPTGPYHLAAQVAELPTVGLWIDHLPSWYDEPRDGLVHILGRQAVARLRQLPGSFTDAAGFKYQSIELDSQIIPADAVIAAVESVLQPTISPAPSIAIPPPVAVLQPRKSKLRSFLRSFFVRTK